ncbi:MAG: septum formation initiator family protein [Candidatus Eisenbacteria bacterium]
MTLRNPRERLRMLRIDFRALLARKQFYRLLGILAGTWLVWTFLLSDDSLIRYAVLRAENRDLIAEIERTEAALDSLGALGADLERDPAAVERVARERYHLLAKGEKSYVFLPVDESEKERPPRLLPPEPEAAGDGETTEKPLTAR